MSFKDLGLGAKVLAAVEDAGYTEPTPIQKQSIPLILEGKDLLGIAQTGTGKTASFTLPMIEILSKGRAKARMPRTLILEPTRELAAQVAENFEKYGKNQKLSMALLIGGVSFADQEQKLERGVDVLIATPGRLLDHCERGKVLLTGVQVLVIDEADRMLDMGFIPDIEEICKKIPFTRQTLCFSATMPPEIQRLTERFMQAPARVEATRPSSTAETVTQRVVHVNDKEKREALRKLIRENEVRNAIIFCNRKRDVSVLARSLEKHGFSAGGLHGDMDQHLRTKTLDAFRSGELKLLVASDVAARGLDIPDVSHVFNFDVPMHAEDYVHRIGRTGRAGREGHAYMLVTKRDDKYLAAIEDIVGRKIEVATVSGMEAPAADSDDEQPKKGRGRSRAKAKPEQKEKSKPEQKEKSKATDSRKESRRGEGKAAAKGERGSRRGSKRDKDDEPVVGMGDHVPAFMLRPVKVPKASRKSAGETESSEAEAEA